MKKHDVKGGRTKFKLKKLKDVPRHFKQPLTLLCIPRQMTRKMYLVNVTHMPDRQREVDSVLRKCIGSKRKEGDYTVEKYRGILFDAAKKGIAISRLCFMACGFEAFIHDIKVSEKPGSLKFIDSQLYHIEKFCWEHQYGESDKVAIDFRKLVRGVSTAIWHRIHVLKRCYTHVRTAKELILSELSEKEAEDVEDAEAAEDSPVPLEEQISMVYHFLTNVKGFRLQKAYLRMMGTIAMMIRMHCCGQKYFGPRTRSEFKKAIIIRNASEKECLLQRLGPTLLLYIIRCSYLVERVGYPRLFHHRILVLSQDLTRRSHETLPECLRCHVPLQMCVFTDG